MQKLAEICIRRPVFAAMLILALVVVGAAGYAKLGVDRVPSVDLPTCFVRVTMPGASPEEMESEVAQKIEEVVNTVEGVDELRAVTGQGSALVIATFNLNRDIDSAAQDVRDRVATVVKRLPRNVDPPVVYKINNDAAAVMSITLSGDRSIRELSELADKIVKRQLERSPGVGSVDLYGDLERTINVWVDADKLAAYQLPVTDVQDALVRQNSDVPGGNITGPVREEALRTMGRFVEPRQIDEMVIKIINGAPIRLKDVGYAEDGSREQRRLSRLNGVPSVSLDIIRQSGANTVEVIEGIKARLPQVIAQLPPGVKLEVVRDQSRYIYAALHEINVHLIAGSVLACLVVLAFMRSWRSTIIAGVAIPTSVISSFAMMWALHFTLNSVTMLALVLMVGIVIDDAIVVLENIFRFIEEKKMTAMEAARYGTAEIGLAVLATTLSLVVIFIPVSFMSSISGRFLYQFGITAAVAVLVSLLVSFTLTPMMSARLLAAEAHKDETRGGSRRGFYHWIDAGYAGMLSFVLRHRLAVFVLAGLVVASSVPLYRSVRQEFTPGDIDEGEFQVSVTAPEGTSFASMDAAMGAVEHEVRSLPQVRTVLATTGGGFISSSNSGWLHVAIAPHEERYASIGRFWSNLLKGDPMATFRGNYVQSQVMQEIRRRLAKYRDLRCSVRNYQAFYVGGSSADIDFVIRGPELEKLAAYTEALRDRSAELGIVDADTTLKLNKPEVRVNIDRERAADLGVDPEQIGTALRLLVGGETQVTQYRDPATNEDYDVQLRLIESGRVHRGQIPQLMLPRAGGGLVELRNLATLEVTDTASRIDRMDRQRSAALRAGVAPGFAMADRIAALREAAAAMNMGPAYTTTITGRGRELERSFTEFLWAFALSVIFMYMILASQYESLIHPVTILLSLPLSVPFALLSLYLTGGTLNLYSALGMLVLFGVVKKNAILQIDHMNQLRAKGMEREAAILQGNRDRLRPILMTTLTLVAGMLPLWLGTGPGSEERRAVAVVVIGGQSLALLLTLLVTPVTYSLLDDLRTAWLARVRLGRTLAPVPAGK